MRCRSAPTHPARRSRARATWSRTRRARSSTAPTAPACRTSTSGPARPSRETARLPRRLEIHAELVDVFAGPAGSRGELVGERLQAIASGETLAQRRLDLGLVPADVAFAAGDHDDDLAAGLDVERAELSAHELLVHLGEL